MTNIGPKCQEILLAILVLLMFILPTIYVIAGVLILLHDNHIYKECYDSNDLHVYVILSIFAFFSKFMLLQFIRKRKNYVFSC